MSHRAGHREKNKRWWIYRNALKRLLMSLTDCHSKRNFDQKSPFAQFEGKWKDVMDTT